MAFSQLFDYVLLNRNWFGCFYNLLCVCYRQKKLMYMTTPAVPLPTFVEYGIPNKPLLASVAARVSKLAVCPWTTVISLEPPAIITNCTQHTFVMHHCGFNQAQKVVPDETIALFCKVKLVFGFSRI